MTLLSALEIAGNYPDNILIDTQKHPEEDKWSSLMYMTREGRIHKLMLSFDNFPFNSKDEALSSMKELAEKAIEYVNERFNKAPQQ